MPTAISQIDCGTEEVPSGFGMLTSPCIDMDIDEVPVKTIRVSFHIFQKDDGSENIQNDAAGNDYLDAIEWSMNHYMINLPMFDYTTSSPYYTDSKIRYEVVKKNFYQNTEMWKKGNYKTTAKGDSLYNFIMSQSIPYKTTSVHLFMPGNFPGIEQDFGGVACGIQCNKWSTTIGVYYKYINSSPSNRNHRDPAKVFRHELGHNFGLNHTFYHSENCSDTPPLNAWSTNNMMDYGDQQSLTQCQLSQMHKWLETNTDIVKSGLPDYSISGQIDWSGGSKSLDNLNFLPDPEFEVNIDASGASNYNWTKTYGSGTWSTNGSGSQADIEIDPSEDHMTFEVTTEANCQLLNESYAFYHFPNFYKIYPNPIQDFIAIELDKSAISQIKAIQNKDVANQVHELKIYNQYNGLIREESLESNFGTYTIDASGYKSGIYMVELRNSYFTKRYKV